ncbi:hypothetical protein JB92DRAFT_3099115 [Gautieria morchelliformis]|nr:hypothetical protein JB92DRAFT_3099115 [Gautieria morchelliformis]
MTPWAADTISYMPAARRGVQMHGGERTRAKCSETGARKSAEKHTEHRAQSINKTARRTQRAGCRARDAGLTKQGRGSAELVRVATRRVRPFTHIRCPDTVMSTSPHTRPPVLIVSRRDSDRQRAVSRRWALEVETGCSRRAEDTKIEVRTHRSKRKRGIRKSPCCQRQDLMADVGRVHREEDDEGGTSDALGARESQRERDVAVCE